MPDDGATRTAVPAAAARGVERPADLRRTFEGIRRPDGRVATRNFIGVLTTVNCSATVARKVARMTEDECADADGVDGVVALTHGTGCGMASRGEGWDVLRRTLAGYARHPNIGGLVVVGLGCEVNAVAGVMADLGVAEHVPVASYTIQELGGTRAAVDAGVELVRGMVSQLAGTARSAVGVEELVLGLQCGGSDGWSGLTANPALGVASDLLVAAGATSLLGETPEVYGAEHLLAARASRPRGGGCPDGADPVVGVLHPRHGHHHRRQPLAGQQGRRHHHDPGEVARRGRQGRGMRRWRPWCSTPRRCRCGPGFVFMDTPGYDPVSVTGMVAGGANLICFTTGRGSVFGSRPVPTVKLASNATTALRMAGDIDLDCSPVVEAGVSMQDMGRQVYDLLLDTASGRVTPSEELGLGGEEFVPWQLGAVL